MSDFASQAHGAVDLGFDTPAGCEDLNIKMSSLGVIIINSDGTMSKIPNWHELSEGERKTAMRVLARRNKKRKEALLAQQAEIEAEVQAQAQAREEAQAEAQTRQGGGEGGDKDADVDAGAGAGADAGIASRRKDVDAAAAAHLTHLQGVASERNELLRQGKVLRCRCCFEGFDGEGTGLGGYTGSGSDNSTDIAGNFALPGLCAPCAEKQGTGEEQPVLMLENGT